MITQFIDLFKDVIIDGRVKCCGMEDRTVKLWLLEDKKANMLHGRENVVAYGRLPSPLITLIHNIATASLLTTA